MTRAALVAGVSIAALVCAGPAPVQARTGNAESWWGTARAVAPKTPDTRKPAKPHAKPGDKSERADKSPPAPTGLLHIIVSIDKQRATLFADGLPFASTAISSGTAGHPTPMGIFTVIQKHKNHVSNLYDAPMPYMQRITWSGSALHEGPLPGYPASHGCVRLSSSFAQLLWKATKMGARVIITRPEVTPVEIEHPNLFVPKPRIAAEPASTSTVAKSASATLIKTASAANAMAAAKAPAAKPQPVANVQPVAEPDAHIAIQEPITDRANDAPAAEQPTKLPITVEISSKPVPVTAAEPVEAKAASTETAEAAPVDAKAVEAETKTVESKTEESKTVETKAVGPAAAETKAVQSKPAEMAPVDTKAVEAKPVAAKPAETTPVIVNERPATMPATVAREAARRPVSVFISLKDSKLYVRQGWQPLFDTPVVIERPDQPIGTHVYTAMGMKSDGSGLRWNVVTIPSDTRLASDIKGAERGRKANERPVKVAHVVTPMPSPSAALDRIVIPPGAVERISEMMAPGSSLIVSDNRMSEETGEYTDFIVTTR